MQRRDSDTYDRYRAQRAVLKQAVKVSIRMAERRTGDGESDWGMVPREIKRCKAREQG